MKIDWEKPTFQLVKSTACCGNCVYYTFNYDACSIDGEGTNIIDWCERYKPNITLIDNAPPLNRILIEEDERRKREE